MKQTTFPHLSRLLLSLCLCVLGLLLPHSVNAQEDYLYLLPDADIGYYTEADISDMSLQVVCYAKNEIYARRGRMFHSQELQGYFDRQPWYSAQYRPEDFSDASLNKYEAANIQLLANRESSLQKGGYRLDQKGYSYTAVDDYRMAHYGLNSFYLFEDSNTRRLTSADTRHMTLQEICYGKNEIYARHGRTFESRELQDYFNSQSWYNGTVSPGKFNENIFNSYEADNVAYLTKLEKSLTDGKGYVLDASGYDISLAQNHVDYGDFWMWDTNYIFADSDSRYLSREELQDYSPRVLCYAKNEIYARRGRMFHSQELQDFFSTKNWYYGSTPEENFSTDIFNQYEAKNVQLLKEMEFAREPGGYQLY